jgi:hypothetical protein
METRKKSLAFAWVCNPGPSRARHCHHTNCAIPAAYRDKIKLKKKQNNVTKEVK